MNKTLLKHSIGLIVMTSMLLGAFVFISPTATAQNELRLWGDDMANSNIIAIQALNNIGLGKRDPRVIVAQLINYMMGMLGIIAVIIILVGGFKWMTASGNEEKVTEAKKLLGAGIIGLLIVLAAWSLAIFIIGRYLGATGAKLDTTVYNL